LLRCAGGSADLTVIPRSAHPNVQRNVIAARASAVTSISQSGLPGEPRNAVALESPSTD
jgi:hypothetical protein